MPRRAAAGAGNDLLLDGGGGKFSLAFDTFATIGVKSVGEGGQPEDQLIINPGFPGFGTPAAPVSQVLSFAGWAITPNEPQADPFNPDFFAGDGRILIGQFSTADGSAIRGTMSIGITDNGYHYHPVVSFYHVPGPDALWLLGAIGLLRSRRRARSSSPRPS